MALHNCRVTLQAVEERLARLKREQELLDAVQGHGAALADNTAPDPLDAILLESQLRTLEQERCYLIGPCSMECAVACLKPIAAVFVFTLLLTSVSSYYVYSLTQSAIATSGAAFMVMNFSSLLYVVPCLFTFRTVSRKYARGFFGQVLVWMTFSYLLCWSVMGVVEKVSFSIFVEPILPLFSELSGQELAEWVAREVPLSFLRGMVLHPQYSMVRENFYSDAKSAEFCETIDKLVRQTF